MQPQQWWLFPEEMLTVGKLNHLPDKFPFSRQLVPTCFTVVSTFFTPRSLQCWQNSVVKIVGFLCRCKDEGEGEVESDGILPYIPSV